MKQISNKEYERYQQYQADNLHGRILTPDGLRVVCAGLDNDPEKIGIHMLEMLAKFRNGGVICGRCPLCQPLRKSCYRTRASRRNIAGYAVGAMTSVNWTTFAWMRWAL